MASRLRIQLASLVTDLSANKLGDASGISSINTITNNLNRLTQYDASNNISLTNIKSITTTNNISIATDASKNLVTNANSVVLNQDTNTTSFINPLPKRGDIASIKFIKTIMPGDISGSLPSNNGPAQQVDIYQLVYYSSNPVNNSTIELVSGSILVPRIITKTTLISYCRGTILSTDDKEELPWLVVSQPSWLGATPSQRSLSFTSNFICLASTGAVVIVADGFGLGVSLNKLSYFTSYYGGVNPQVDMIRAFRKYVEYTKSIGSSLFQNRFNSYPINVLQTGYSLGAIVSPGVAQEFKQGVSREMDWSEASKFNIMKLVTGAGFDASDYINNIINNYESEPNLRYIPPSFINLLFLVCGNYNSYDGLTKNAQKNIVPLLDEDLTKGMINTFFGTDLNTNIFNQLNYDYWSNEEELSARNPAVLEPSSYNLIFNPPLAQDVPVYDIFQAFTLEGLKKGITLLRNYIPWVSKLRSLKDLSGVPIVNIFSKQDELIHPIPEIDATAPLITDGVSNLAGNIYGPIDSNGNPRYVFPGANKTISSLDVSGGDLAINPISGTEAQMLGVILTMTNQQFINIGVDMTNPALSALGGHSSFHFYYMVYLILLAQNLS